MSFTDHVLFAAIATLMEEMQEQENNGRADSYPSDYCEYTMPSFTPDATYYIDQLCNIAQELFDGADAACNSECSTSAKKLIPPIICGVIFESIDALTLENSSKIKFYRVASEFCNVEDTFPAEFLFSNEQPQLSAALTELTAGSFNMILVAAQKSGKDDAYIGFIKIFCEFMLYLEDYLSNSSGISMQNRPSLVVLEKALSTVKSHKQQMEVDNPALKSEYGQAHTSNNKNAIDNLLSQARTERKYKNMAQAEKCYKKILEISPDNWEAQIFSTLCSVYHSSSTTNPSAIQNYTEEIIRCIPGAMELAKKQLYSRGEIIDSIGDVATLATELASNYFVAAMNRYKSVGRSAIANKAKIAQVNAIIQMLFVVGDNIDAHFNNDTELCAYTACGCWRIAFDCYENCDMPAPQGLSEHYYKIVKYIPDYRCAKPLSEGTAQVSSSSEGCYIATAVYGSYDCPPVWTLRRFRDHFLAVRWYGRLFIRFYYAVSPRLVEIFKDTKWFTRLCKYPLDKLVTHLNENGYKDTAYADHPVHSQMEDN